MNNILTLRMTFEFFSNKLHFTRFFSLFSVLKFCYDFSFQNRNRTQEQRLWKFHAYFADTIQTTNLMALQVNVSFTCLLYSVFQDRDYNLYLLVWVTRLFQNHVSSKLRIPFFSFSSSWHINRISLSLNSPANLSFQFGLPSARSA